MTLDSINSDLLAVMNDSERWSEAKDLSEKWLHEKDEMSELVMQLRSSVEREMKEKERLSQEVSMHKSTEYSWKVVCWQVMLLAPIEFF